MMNQKNTEQDKIKNAAAASGRYSMHTMSFCTGLTSRGAKTIREKLITYCEAEGLRYYERKNEWTDTKELIFPGFLTYGLNSVKVKTIAKNSGKIYYLQIKVNPRMMFHMDSHPFVYIADADDVRNSLDRIQDFLNMTDINGISKECFYIQRIDYCANIRLKSKYEVEDICGLSGKDYALIAQLEKRNAAKHRGDGYRPGTHLRCVANPMNSQFMTSRAR